MSPMKQELLISIIMVTYNRAGFIGETVSSILAQTYTHWELLIFDDGSDDATEEVVARLRDQDARIRYYKKERCGITGIFKNEGIRLAQGTVIAFMDSDDLWPVQKLAIQLEALHARPEAGFSFTNGFNFLSDTGAVEAYFYTEKEGILCANFFDEVCEGTMGIRLPTVMVRKQILKGDLLFRENRPFTDYSFVGQLAARYQGIRLGDLLFERRVHPANFSASGWQHDFEEHLDMIARFRDQGKITAGRASSLLSMIYRNFGMAYAQRKCFPEARSMFLKSWSYDRLGWNTLKQLAKTYLPAP